VHGCCYAPSKPIATLNKIFQSSVIAYSCLVSIS
jgi:hypothetical protein